MIACRWRTTFRFHPGFCFRIRANERHPADGGADFRPRAHDGHSARGADVVAGRQAPDLHGWRRADRSRSGHRAAARAGEPGQAGRAVRRRMRAEQDRDHRERYKMASYIVGAGFAASSVRLRRAALALRSGQRHRPADRIYRYRGRRRSQVFSQRGRRHLYPQSRAERGAPGGHQRHRTVSVGARSQRSHC